MCFFIKKIPFSFFKASLQTPLSAVRGAESIAMQPFLPWLPFYLQRDPEVLLLGSAGTLLRPLISHGPCWQVGGKGFDCCCHRATPLGSPVLLQGRCLAPQLGCRAQCHHGMRGSGLQHRDQHCQLLLLQAGEGNPSPSLPPSFLGSTNSHLVKSSRNLTPFPSGRWGLKSSQGRFAVKSNDFSSRWNVERCGGGTGKGAEGWGSLCAPRAAACSHAAALRRGWERLANCGGEKYDGM